MPAIAPLATGQPNKSDNNPAPSTDPIKDKNNNNDDSNSDTDSDDEEEQSTINKVACLRKGIIRTVKNTGKVEFTILVVGETGVGKSSVLEFIANVLAGNSISKYDFKIIDQENESGDSEKHSQTNSAKLYSFTSQNDVVVRILDTPGLADTRGIEQDEKHKRSIANVITKSITTVNAVLILANGTVPRITVGTDYALSTLSAIFPRSLATNIAFLFTNVATPLGWNFAQDTVPPVLKDAPQFLLDNPLALRKKYLSLKVSPNTTRQLKKEMQEAVKAGEEKALSMLVRLFDWLDSLPAQPTQEILTLYNQAKEIETQINNTLAQMDQAALKRQEIKAAINGLETAKSHMEIYRQYETTAKRKVKVQTKTQDHNTLCTMSDCYSNCHIGCGLNFTLDQEKLRDCSSMQPTGETCKKSKCGHPRDRHQHFNVIWEDEEQEQKIMDDDMKKKFIDAGDEKDKKEQLKNMLEGSLDTLAKHIQENTEKLTTLASDYANLSLSGSFSSQVEKAVKMLEQHHKAMEEKGVDKATLDKVQRSLDEMKRKLDLLRKAQNESEGGIARRIYNKVTRRS